MKILDFKKWAAPSILAASFLVLSGCAGAPKIPQRPQLNEIEDTAYRMKLYYEYRLNKGKQGWYVLWSDKETYLGDGDLPEFFRLNRDQTAQDWAIGANRFDKTGWLLGAAVEGVFVAASLNAVDETFKPMWAYGLPLAALTTWSFTAIADRWFRWPAVNHYNRELKRELNISPE